MSSVYHQRPSPELKEFIQRGKRRSRILNVILILSLSFLFVSNIPDVNHASAIEYQEPLGVYDLPGQGDCSMAGAWDGQYYYAIDSNCFSSTVLIYKLKGQKAIFHGRRDIVDSIDKRPVMISNLVWDSKRKKFWAAHARSIYLISMDAIFQVNGASRTNRAIAEKIFVSESSGNYANRGGSYAIGGMAYEVSDDSLYIVPDSHPRIYQYHLSAKGGGEALVRVLTPKEARKSPNIFSHSPEVSKIRMSGIAVAGSQLIVGVNKSKKLVALSKSNGIVLSESLIDMQMIGSITCVSGEFGEYPDKYKVMIKDVYGGSLHTYMVNDLQCDK